MIISHNPLRRGVIISHNFQLPTPCLGFSLLQGGWCTLVGAIYYVKQIGQGLVWVEPKKIIIQAKLQSIFGFVGHTYTRQYCISHLPFVPAWPTNSMTLTRGLYECRQAVISWTLSRYCEERQTARQGDRMTPFKQHINKAYYSMYSESQVREAGSLNE